jgi:hypothetical protein
MKKLMLVVLSFVFSAVAVAESPIILVGASYAHGATPYNDELEAPLGGISVGFGDYLSLGNALVRNRSLSGHVINEAAGGATTFDRMVCNPTCTPSVMWQGYEKQLTKALGRVTAYDPLTGEANINAKYVFIALPNDCMHSDAFGIPQSQAQPCGTAELNELVDRLIALGQRVLDLGLTPVFNIPPTYEQLDLALFRDLFGLNWSMDKANYDEMLNIRATRIAAELPGAVQLKIWQKFVHLGDGIHPNRRSVIHAAKKIAKFIRRNEVRDKQAIDD